MLAWSHLRRYNTIPASSISSPACCKIAGSSTASTARSFAAIAPTSSPTPPMLISTPTETGRYGRSSPHLINCFHPIGRRPPAWRGTVAAPLPRVDPTKRCR